MSLEEDELPPLPDMPPLEEEKKEERQENNKDPEKAEERRLNLVPRTRVAAPYAPNHYESYSMPFPPPGYYLNPPPPLNDETVDDCSNRPTDPGLLPPAPPGDFHQPTFGYHIPFHTMPPSPFYNYPNPPRVPCPVTPSPGGHWPPSGPYEQHSALYLQPHHAHQPAQGAFDGEHENVRAAAKEAPATAEATSMENRLPPSDPHEGSPFYSPVYPPYYHAQQAAQENMFGQGANAHATTEVAPTISKQKSTRDTFLPTSGPYGGNSGYYWQPYTFPPHQAPAQGLAKHAGTNGTVAARGAQSAVKETPATTTSKTKEMGTKDVAKIPAAVTKTSPKSPGKIPPDLVSKRLRKNTAARTRAANLKEKITKIEAKPEKERTEDEKELFAKWVDRRMKKNTRSKERSLEKAAGIARILAKPEKERTPSEVAWLTVAMNARATKNLRDKERRMRAKMAKSLVPPVKMTSNLDLFHEKQHQEREKDVLHQATFHPPPLSEASAASEEKYEK